MAYRNVNVILDGSGSYDPDGPEDIVEYRWDFGDNQSTVGASAIVLHKYSNLGNYTVTLTVKDAAGETSSDTCLVEIINRPPVANAGEDHLITALTTALKATVALEGSASNDPDGSIVEYKWDFGDGSSPAYGEVVTHQYTGLGNYEVTLTVKDNDGATAIDSCMVTMNLKAVTPSGDPTKILVAMPTATGELPPGLDVPEKTIYLTAEEFAQYSTTAQSGKDKKGKGFQVYQK